MQNFSNEDKIVESDTVNNWDNNDVDNDNNVYDSCNTITIKKIRNNDDDSDNYKLRNWKRIIPTL